MTLFSVYVREGEEPIALADRFSWSAALFPPVHALAGGAWAMLAVWVAGIVAIAGLSLVIGGAAAGWLYALLATWFGFAAGGFHARALHRRGWRHGSEVMAADGDMALVDWLTRK